MSVFPFDMYAAFVSVAGEYVHDRCRGGPCKVSCCSCKLLLPQWQVSTYMADVGGGPCKVSCGSCKLPLPQ